MPVSHGYEIFKFVTNASVNQTKFQHVIVYDAVIMIHYCMGASDTEIP